MIAETDIAYFRRRADRERARAAAADQPEVRRAHLELAALYADRCGGDAAAPPPAITAGRDA